MAESVQYYLERMIPELEALERKNIFTPVSRLFLFTFYHYLTSLFFFRLKSSLLLKREPISNMLYNVVLSKK